MDTLRVGIKAGAVGFGMIAILSILDDLELLFGIGKYIFPFFGFMFGMLSCYFSLSVVGDGKWRSLLASGAIAGLLTGLASSLFPFFHSIQNWFTYESLRTMETIQSGLGESHIVFYLLSGSVVLGAWGASMGMLLSKPRQNLVLSYANSKSRIELMLTWFRLVMILCIYGLVILVILGGLYNSAYSPHVSKAEIFRLFWPRWFIFGSIPITMFYFASFVRSKAIARSDHLLFRWWNLFGISFSILWLYISFISIWLSLIIHASD